jgi:hypothetical protein
VSKIAKKFYEWCEGKKPETDSGEVQKQVRVDGVVHNRNEQKKQTDFKEAGRTSSVPRNEHVTGSLGRVELTEETPDGKLITHVKGVPAPVDEAPPVKIGTADSKKRIPLPPKALIAYRQDMEGESYMRRPTASTINSWKDDANYRPERNPDKIAKDNWELLEQFLNGTGKTTQLHSDRGDLLLEQFIQSPGSQAMRDQFAKGGYPAHTDKLGYGSLQAFVDTVAKPLIDSAGSGFSNLLDENHWGNVTTQIGGFGNPPKDSSYAWATATATATRCNATGQVDPFGNHVQYQMINVAGRQSFAYHADHDFLPGTEGPQRSIIQVFRWTEPLSTSTNSK